MAEERGGQSFGRGMLLRVVALYFLGGVLWIVASDRVLRVFVAGEDELTRVQTYKGWAYVTVTAALLYLLLAGLYQRHQRVKEARREAERRYQHLLDAANEGVWQTDIEGRTVRVNRRLAEMLNRSPERLVAEGVDSLVDAEGKAVLARGLEERRQGRAGEYELAFRVEPGRVVQAKVAASPEYDESGKFRGVLRLVTDITELRRMQDELRGSLDANVRLLDEIDHRVRNNLASILSLIYLARVRRESDRTGPEPLEVLERRVRAMTAAHAMLSDRHWCDIDFRDLLSRVFDDGETNRLSAHGPDCTIRPGHVTALACALSEIVSNSRVHGSLGEAGGSVTVSWHLRRGNENRRELVIEWVEHRREPIAGEPGVGTGLGLIRGFIEHDLSGSFSAAFPREGARLTIVVPADGAVSSEGRGVGAEPAAGAALTPR